MKNILHKLHRWLWNFWTGDLFSECENLKSNVIRLQVELDAMTFRFHGCSAQKVRLNAEIKQWGKDYQHLRSQVMQIRVENSDPSGRGRIGWQVSAFIPESVIRNAKENPAQLMSIVNNTARSLVRNAFQGIVKLSSLGTSQAIIFEPLSLDSTKTVVSTWFEADKSHPSLVYGCGDIAEVRKVIPNADNVMQVSIEQRLLQPAKES